MRKLSAALAGVFLAATLCSPAWADPTESRHHRFRGRSESPYDGRRGDRQQHDDPSILF
jgi:hypothetical protein